MFVRAISFSSFFNFWKLDYFSDINCSKNPLYLTWSYVLLQPSNCIIFFLVILESTIGSGYFHRTLTPFQSEKLLLKVSQYVCCIIWESHYTRIIVARLLKLAESYPEVYPYFKLVWVLISFFRTGLKKYLRPAANFIFLMM